MGSLQYPVGFVRLGNCLAIVLDPQMPVVDLLESGRSGESVHVYLCALPRSE